MNEITVIPEAQKDAQLYVEPKESYIAEIKKKAQYEVVKELKDYELMVEAWVRWLYQRIQTTELVMPYINVGRPEKGNDDVTFLADFGFSKMQWSRRRKEAELKERIEEYVDYCTGEDRQPTIFGFYSYGKEGEAKEPQIREWWGNIPEGITKMTLIVLAETVKSFGSESEANEFLKRWAARMPDRIAEDLLDTEVERTPWVKGEFKIDGFQSSPEQDMLLTTVYNAFEELTDKDPMVALQALAFIVADGEDWAGATIPVKDTFIKKAIERRESENTQPHTDTE